jgi:hypothetical protein
VGARARLRKTANQPAGNLIQQARLNAFWEWCARGDDFRTFLHGFVTLLPQDGFSNEITL